MGSLTGKKKSKIFLTTVTVLLLAMSTVLAVSLFSPPASAEEDLELRKIRRLEILGMDSQDPAIVEAARQAVTLFSVDVLPNEEEISVVLQLSDVPAYDTYIYPGNRLVVDLRNTINLSPTPLFTLEENDAIKKVRNSQYRVTPSFISRVVLDMDENTTPQINNVGGNLVISALTAEPAPMKEAVETPTAPEIIEPSEAEPAEADVPSETVPAPAVEIIETATAEAVEVLAVEPEQAAIEIVEVAEEPVVEAAPAVEEEEAVEEISAEMPMEEAAPEEIVEEAEVVEIEEVEPVAPEPMPVIEQAEPPAPKQIEAPVVEITSAPAAPKAATPESITDQTRVTLTFREAEILAVLDILARKGKLNILAGKDVKGKVTVRLVDVPLDVALNAILNVNGYGYVKSDNIIRILPLKELGEVVNTVTTSYPLSYASANKAKTILDGFLTPNGKIQIDERTNMIIVTDVPSNMERIAKLLPDIDKRVKQVLIEVLIIDSVLGDEADMGISWALANARDNSLVDPTGDAFPDQAGVLLPREVDALTLSFRTIMGDFDLTGFLEAMVAESESQVLANPKVLTLNNEKAEIEIITEFPYRDITETSAGGELSETKFKDIGTKLEVKPQITHDDHVILFIAPEQSSIEDLVGNAPVVATRRAETTLILKNHQTIVLGGLRENRRNNDIDKVPLLGDLPGIKYIFRSVHSRKTDTELLLFITVHIVETPELLPEQELKANELANMPRQPNASIELIR